MAKYEEYKPILENLNSRTVNDYTKVLKEGIKKLNEQKAQIPIRIDELSKGLISNDEIDYSKLDSPNEAINENNEKILGNKDGLNFEFENNEQDVYYRIPFFYYKGYAAKIIKENGEEEKLDVSLGEGGLVKVENANSKGKIVVWYKGTAIQKISYTITFSILVFIVAIYFYKHIKKDK